MSKPKKKPKFWWVVKMRAKPCPCCGNSKVYIGPLAFLTFGVECKDVETLKGCRLTIGRDIPYRMPRGIKSLEELEIWTMKKAIKAWDRRTR